MVDKFRYTRVAYDPDPATVNLYIKSLNEQSGIVPAHEMAKVLASTIASVAYIMSQSNDVDTIKTLFNSLVDEANAKFVAREKLIADQLKKEGLKLI